MDRQCNEAEGARLLETMRKICDTTGCQEVEHATLAYEKTLQETAIRTKHEVPTRQFLKERIVPS